MSKLIKSNSDVFQPPFSLINIAKGIKCDHLIKSFENQNQIERNESRAFSNKTIMSSHSDNLKFTTKSLELTSIKLQKDLDKNFTFHPKLHKKNFPKIRPYLPILDKMKKEETKVNEKMFEDLYFANKIKMNNILNKINSNLNNRNSHIYLSKNNKLISDNLNLLSPKKQKVEMRIYGKIISIGGIKLPKLVEERRESESLDGFEFFTRDKKLHKLNTKRNRDIIEKNNHISINCLQSNLEKDITTNQIFLSKIKNVSINNKLNEKRMKILNEKLIKVIRNED